MDRVFMTIAKPWKVFPSPAEQLYLGSKLPDGGTYVVVLNVGKAGHMDFKSAYPRSEAEISTMLLRRRPENPGRLKPQPLQKSETLAGKSEGFHPTAHGSLGHLVPVQSPEPRCLAPREGSPLAMGIDNVARFFDLFKALAPGEPRITVHPNGPGSKGQPVLIQPQPDGSAKVVGGAGGKLNHLRLKGVRSPEDYKAEAANRAAAHREQRKEQVRKDRESGLHQAKQRAHEVLRASLGDRKAAFVQTVARVTGLPPERLEFPAHLYANATPSAREAAAKKHAAEIYRWAKGVEKRTRARLVQDGEARAAAGLGEVRLTGREPGELTVADLDALGGSPRGLGYATNYAERAGATADEVREEGPAPVGARSVAAVMACLPGGPAGAAHAPARPSPCGTPRGRDGSGRAGTGGGSSRVEGVEGGGGFPRSSLCARAHV